MRGMQVLGCSSSHELTCRLTSRRRDAWTGPGSGARTCVLVRGEHSFKYVRACLHSYAELWGWHCRGMPRPGCKCGYTRCAPLAGCHARPFHGRTHTCQAGDGTRRISACVPTRVSHGDMPGMQLHGLRARPFGSRRFHRAGWRPPEGPPALSAAGDGPCCFSSLNRPT